MTLYSTSSSL